MNYLAIGIVAVMVVGAFIWLDAICTQMNKEQEEIARRKAARNK